MAEYDAALEIDPNYYAVYVSKGIALILSGRAREAFSPVQLALRVSPKDPLVFLWRFWLSHAHLHLHEYEGTIEECRRALNMNSSYWFAYADLISAYGSTGQLEQAREASAALSKLRPDFSVQGHRQFTYGYTSPTSFRMQSTSA